MNCGILLKVSHLSWLALVHDNDVETGSLLPLYRMQNAQTGQKSVTALRWNTVYNDMFAIAYGSYDFMKQGLGAVACWSLKNTEHPTLSFVTESGATALSFNNSDIPSMRGRLLAVGMYDGGVGVWE